MRSEKYRRNHNRNQAAVVIRSVAKTVLLLACLVRSFTAAAAVGDDWLEQDFEADSAAVNEGNCRPSPNT